MGTLKDIFTAFKSQSVEDIFRSKSSDINFQEVTASRLHEVLKCCPICNDGFPGHSYAWIGMAPMDSRNQTNELFKAVAKRQWSRVQGFQIWEPTSDNALVFAIRCITNNSIIIIIEDPYALDYTDSLLSIDSLSPEGSRELDASIASSEWHSF